MTGTLDLCSHRLDAWITSFATKRLAEMRKANPAGVLFGGYGWVMNLKPAAAQTQVAPPPGEPDPVFQSANNPGFVHTPSLTQAATAAVLRSGHLAHAGKVKCRTICWPSICRPSVCVWRRGCSTAYGKGNRSARCSAIGSSAACRKRGKAQFISFFRELAPLVARKMESTLNRGAGRSHRRQQRRGRPRTAAAMAGATTFVPALRRCPELGDVCSRRLTNRPPAC